MVEHRESLAGDQREFVEIERTIRDGVTHIILSCLAGLTEVAEPERYEHPRNGVFDLHVFADGQGRRWHVATQAVEGLEARRSRIVDGVTVEKQFVPARELWFGYGAQEGYYTRQDLLTALEDPETRTAMWEEVEARRERAAQAALAHGGVVERLSRPGLVDQPAMLMDRTAYEAACEELGLLPASPQEVLTWRGIDGEYTLGDYSLDHILYASLLRGHRLYAEREQKADRQRRLAEVDAAHPGPAYTRAEFEAACRTAEIDAPDDAEVEQILNPYVFAGDEDPLRVTLAQRRGRGMIAQAREEGRRCDECGRLIPGSSGMNASRGLACEVGCYDAMSDRPGRYANRHSA